MLSKNRQNERLYSILILQRGQNAAYAANLSSLSNRNIRKPYIPFSESASNRGLASHRAMS